MKPHLIIILCISLIWGCSQKPTDETSTKEEVNTIAEDTIAEEVVIEGVKEETRRVYKTTLNKKTTYYILENEKWGLEYEDSSTLLPMEFDKIFSPDATAKEYVEVEKDGKLGLFDYKRQIMISPKYDLIFPADGTKYIAMGKIGNQFFGILSEKESEVLSSEDSPSYANLEAETILDLNNSKAIPIFSLQQEDEYTSNGILFIPSFVNNLGLTDNKLEYVSFGSGEDYGITQASAKIKRAETITDQLVLLFTSFYEEGVDGRDYTIEKTRVATINESNQVIDSKQIAEKYSSDKAILNICDKGLFDYFRIEERLLEIQDIKPTEGNYSNYASMTQFNYYKITEDGKLKKLESNRFYDCTKFASINSSHFEGCFYTYSNSEDDMEKGNIWVSNHLSIEDLDIMRNEIFAEYGYKFKSEKWQKYFSGKKWYSPKHENVDQFLTDLDKENIKTILKLKERMKQVGEEKFTNKTREMLMMAG